MLALGIKLKGAAELIFGFGQIYAHRFEVRSHVLECLRDFRAVAQRPELVIERNLLAEAIRDVSEVAQRG